MSRRDLESLRILLGPGATKAQLSERLQSAVDLAIAEVALPLAVEATLNGFFATETIEALREVQRAFVHSGAEGLPVASLIQLIVELLDGGWLSCPEAAHALSRLEQDAPDQLAASSQRLLEIASMVAHDEAEGWMGACDDSLFRDALARYRADRCMPSPGSSPCS